jgi:hypothetical protein
MHANDTKRLATRRRRTLIITAIALLVPLAALTAASPALAEPKGIFKVFNDCPTEVSSVYLCQYAETTSGEFAIGSTKVTINKPIILQGGAAPVGAENPNEYTLVAAKDGNTLSKTELNVPGGLAGLINCEEIKGEGLLEKLTRATCKTTFENGVTGVTATTELASTPSNPVVLNLAALVEEKGAALTMPIKVHLKNPLLGESCYIGSTSSPIELHMTTGATSPPGPNKSIHGKLGTPVSEVENEQEAVTIHENTLVDNAFSVPVVNGCGGLASILLDPIIDAKLGLESPSGHNTAVFNGTLKDAEKTAVIASESF